MHSKFATIVEMLNPSFESLLAMKPVKEGNFDCVVPKKGVYLFTESNIHLYVGRSNTIRQRYSGHCNLSAKHHTAAFAFRLARESTGIIKASYKVGEHSRTGLMANQIFVDAFNAAKKRIRNMEFRFVEENDPNRQALLEMYCAIVLETRYNDFDNH